MSQLHLSPLPCMRQETSDAATAPVRDEFVDEAVILALLAGPVATRPIPATADLALAADEMDFAGWRLSPFLPASATEASETTSRRAAPPVLEEPGLGKPHRGNHRWWLAGLAGAFSTVVFSLLLLSLSSRKSPEIDGLSIFHPPAKPLVSPAKDAKNEKTSLELTGSPSDR